MSGTFSRKVSVAKYADNLYLLQPVDKVSRIGKLRKDSSHARQSYSQESFATFFQRAIQNHEKAKKQTANKFDMVC